jgi:hypothetical protein
LRSAQAVDGANENAALAAFFFVRSFVSCVTIKLKALRSIRFDNLLCWFGAAHDRITAAAYL